MQASDNEIIERILAGEGKAYALLVDRHKEKGMALAFRMLRSRMDAEEALQDAFVRAFRSLGGFERKSAFSTWFYRIVYNVCASRLSKKQEVLHATIDESQELVEETDSRETPQDVSLANQESDSIILEEINKLPAVFGTTFFLFAVEERTYEEIVEITGVPLGTVKARLFRARVMLRESVGRRLEVGMNRNSSKGAAA